MRFLLSFLALAGLAAGQTTGDIQFTRKKSTAGWEPRLVSGTANSLFATDGSGLPTWNELDRDRGPLSHTLMSQQRILIVLSAGQLQGASITTDRGDPAPLDLSSLQTLIPSINAAALASKAELENTLASVQAKLEILDPAAAAVAREVIEMPAKVREKEALRAKIAADQARLAELETKAAAAVKS